MQGTVQFVVQGKLCSWENDDGYLVDTRTCTVHREYSKGFVRWVCASEEKMYTYVD
jgi:hypothetical protein